MNYREKMTLLIVGIGTWLCVCNLLFILIAEPRTMAAGLVDGFFITSVLFTTSIIIFVVNLFKQFDKSLEDNGEDNQFRPNFKHHF